MSEDSNQLTTNVLVTFYRNDAPILQNVRCYSADFDSADDSGNPPEEITLVAASPLNAACWDRLRIDRGEALYEVYSCHRPTSATIAITARLLSGGN